MQIEARRIACRPHTNRIFRGRVERPDFSAALRIERLERAAITDQGGTCDEAPECVHLDAHKVRSRQAFPVGFQKSRPSSVSVPLRSTLDAVLTEDVGDGAAPDLMSQIRE